MKKSMVSGLLFGAALLLVSPMQAADGIPLMKINQPLQSRARKEEARRCSEYFFAFPAFDEHGPVVNYMQILGGTHWQVLAERDQFRVVIDDAKTVPEAATVPDPKGTWKRLVMLYLSKRDYEAASTCLPKPMAGRRKLVACGFLFLEFRG